VPRSAHSAAFHIPISNPVTVGKTNLPLTDNCDEHDRVRGAEISLGGSFLVIAPHPVTGAAGR
jgi:hypothetical protein